MGAREHVDQDELVERFAARLGEFARELSTSEREVLVKLLYRAATPLERLRWTDPADVLDPDEQETLRQVRASEGQS